MESKINDYINNYKHDTELIQKTLNTLMNQTNELNKALSEFNEKESQSILVKPILSNTSIPEYLYILKPIYTESNIQCSKCNGDRICKEYNENGQLVRVVCDCIKDIVSYIPESIKVLYDTDNTLVCRYNDDIINILKADIKSDFDLMNNDVYDIYDNIEACNNHIAYLNKHK